MISLSNGDWDWDWDWDPNPQYFLQFIDYYDLFYYIYIFVKIILDLHIDN
jgi:hypothetical protein